MRKSLGCRPSPLGVPPQTPQGISSLDPSSLRAILIVSPKINAKDVSPLIEFKHVSKTYPNGVKGLKDVNLQF